MTTYGDLQLMSTHLQTALPRLSWQNETKLYNTWSALLTARSIGLVVQPSCFAAQALLPQLGTRCRRPGATPSCCTTCGCVCRGRFTKDKTLRLLLVLRCTCAAADACVAAVREHMRVSPVVEQQDLILVVHVHGRRQLKLLRGRQGHRDQSFNNG